MTKSEINERQTWRKILAFILLVLLFGAANVHAQFPPKELKNLKVFPKDIATNELIENMKGFTRALGVRCQHCHVGEEGMPLSEFDFPADEKETKEIARFMLKMTKEINSQYMTKLGREKTIEVNCITCHHGQNLPQTLEEVLLATVSEEGIQAAITKYHDLRERYYGSFVYDFRENVLTRLASRLAMQNQSEEAIEILKLNIDHYPKSFLSYFTLAELYATKGDKALAKQNYEKVMELQPNPFVKKKLEALEKE